jgi:hypothetical protein
LARLRSGLFLGREKTLIFILINPLYAYGFSVVVG